MKRQKHSLLVGLAVFLLVSMSTTHDIKLFSVVEGVDENDSVRDQLIAIEKQSWVAWQAHDGKFFDQFLADDHVEVEPGGFSNKKQVVDGVASGFCKVESYSLGEMKFTRISEDTAILNYQAEQKTNCGTSQVPTPALISSVLVKRNGKWVNILFQQTPLAKRANN